VYQSTENLIRAKLRAALSINIKNLAIWWREKNYGNHRGVSQQI
jgi:hypothetical protein